MDANITWTAEGIKQTIQDGIPLIGGFVTGVKTTVGRHHRVEGLLGRHRRQAGGGRQRALAADVGTHRAGLLASPRDGPACFGRFTSQLTKKYPLGIHADSVKVTDTGVVSQFSTQNAKIPGRRDDPCFADLWAASGIGSGSDQPVEHRAGAR